MEFLEKVGDFFGAATSKVERGITTMFGSSNERRIRKLGFVREKDGSTRIVPGSLLDRINQLEPEWQKLTDDELRGSTARLRKRLRAGESLDDLLPDAFAAVRESGRRFLQMRHYEVQMIGGYIMHHGGIAEMVTGEGKTLVATLPTFLNALAGHVHVITVNDYLALRDMEWMGPIYLNLGLTVGAIQSNMGPQERQKNYACDITYGTSNQFGFDYLRDNMKPRRELQVQGPLHYAVVDEIDNILIDEARTPLIISGPAHDNRDKYPVADRIARQLIAGQDFEVKEKEHSCHLTEEGTRKAEQLAGVESFYTAGNMEWPHLLDNSLKAHHLYKKDVNYVVERGEIIIVDENTGRKMEGRQWSDGLHQAVEAKEGVRIKEETQTLATITLQNYFKLYRKLSGMTGTAMTEAEEFWKIYELDVVAIPTNRPMQRINYPDNVYGTEAEKWSAVVEEIREVHATGRPVLVGTTSIELSEMLGNRLRKKGIAHEVLNAKQHEREAEIVAQAGRRNAVTLATNMAGRGTDIVLGGNPEHAAWEELKTKYESRLDVSKAEWDALTKEIADREGMTAEAKEVQDLGGLHVIGTERHDSRRIDLQLRGRAGRQGDPGSSRFFISLDDKLLRLFAGDRIKGILQWAGLRDGEPIVSPMVTRKVEGAQKKKEEQHFDQRKNLLEYDEVMDEQRKRVYGERQKILDGADCREMLLEMMDEQIEQWVRNFLAGNHREDSIVQWAESHLNLTLGASEVRGFELEQLQEYLRKEGIEQAERQIWEQIDENLPEEAEDRSTWNWMALTRWANRLFQLNLNDRDLKKRERSDLHPFLFGEAEKAIHRWDLSPLEAYLDPQFEQKELAGWANGQFLLNIDAGEIDPEDQGAVVSMLKQAVRERYDRKEVTFPVRVGFAAFLSGDGNQDERTRRENLARWANKRFHTNLEPEQFASMKNSEIEALLLGISEKFFSQRPQAADVNAGLDRIIPLPDPEAEAARDTPTLVGTEAAAELGQWASDSLRMVVNTEAVGNLPIVEARRDLLEAIQSTYRPELRQTERTILLEIIDSQWKDHLYFMGHLKTGLSFVGLAQKDPRTEYKREGRRAFLAMWDRIGEFASRNLFRMEDEAPAFVGSLWQISATQHDIAPPEPSPSAPESPEYMESGPGDGDGEGGVATAPIVNKNPKVGRNDPCPCGSGKKYKKCCGR